MKPRNKSIHRHILKCLSSGYGSFRKKSHSSISMISSFGLTNIIHNHSQLFSITKPLSNRLREKNISSRRSIHISRCIKKRNRSDHICLVGFSKKNSSLSSTCKIKRRVYKKTIPCSVNWSLYSFFRGKWHLWNSRINIISYNWIGSQSTYW